MLRVQDVSLANGRQISFDVPVGGALALMGRSGSGKSLTLRRIADLDPGEGIIRLSDVAQSDVPAPAWRRRVALVMSEVAFWKARLLDHAPAAPFEDLGLAQDRQTCPVAELSSGERLRGALALALARKPDVLLLDEPTGPLDPATTARVEAVLRDYSAAGGILVLTTHDPDLPARLGAREVMLP
ncbi:MAG: ABC transporter ATP-binding protein [Pseudomonadota bacterium]